MEERLQVIVSEDEEYMQEGGYQGGRGNQGDRYPNQNQGDRYPNQNQGDRYPNQNQGDRYPNQNQGDRYPNQNQGGRYPGENPGVRFPEDNQGSRYPGENQGRNPGQGQQYPSRGDQSDGGQEDRYRPYQPENNPASMGQQDYYVEPGNNVQLVADVIGNMSPGISTIWKRGDGQPINQRYYQQNNILYINNAERVDEGIYVCQGVDNRGSILFEYNANLRIAGKDL